MSERAANRRIVVDPGLTFAELRTRLEGQGWRARPVTTVAPSILPGEPEVAQWRFDADDTLLTYTFNPAVHLRVLNLSGDTAASHADALVRTLPQLTADDIARALVAGDSATVLRGILAASVLQAFEFEAAIGLLAAHREPAVADAAARVHLELLHGHAARLAGGGRLDALPQVLDAICGNALPLLAALPAATPDEILGLQPMEEDCDAVFAGGIGRQVFEAYDELFTTPPRVAPGPGRTDLQIHACPASLLATDNAFSRMFPAGYGDVAPYLRDDRVWLAWRYCAPGHRSGLAFNGLVHARGHWVWFPKAYDIVGRLAHGAPPIAPGGR